MRNALGDEYYYDSDTTESSKYTNNEVANLLKTKQEEPAYHTISSYRNLINKGKSVCYTVYLTLSKTKLIVRNILNNLIDKFL